jgi:hypothetical protein
MDVIYEWLFLRGIARNFSSGRQPKYLYGKNLGGFLEFFVKYASKIKLFFHPIHPHKGA